VEIAVSIIVAYLLCGIAQVVQDLTANPTKRPAWARRPTAGKAVLYSALWFTRPFVGAVQPHRLHGVRQSVLNVVTGLAFCRHLSGAASPSLSTFPIAYYCRWLPLQHS
jgi:hypothetical protein